MIGAIMGGVSIASSLLGGRSAKKAAKASARRAKKIGKLNADEFMKQAGLEREFNSDALASMQDTQKRIQETVRGMYGGSNLLETGTVSYAMNEQKETDAYNLKQTDKAGKSRVEGLEHQAKMARLGAKDAAAGYKSQGRAAMTSAITGAIGGGMQMAGSLGNWMNLNNTAKKAGTAGPSAWDWMARDFKG